MAFGLVDLHRKGMLAGQSLVNPRNWLALGEQVSPVSGRPPKSKHHSKKTHLIQVDTITLFYRRQSSSPEE